MLLVCGLGNKDASYRYTRHNIGYLVLDAFSDRFDIPFSKKMSGCMIGTGQGVCLAKPDTYMNLSGVPLSSFMRKKGIPAENLIVVHDDLDMDFGRMRIKWDGGDGGHKGVRSVADNLHTVLFYRLKIGIGRDPAMMPEQYVLSRFTMEEAAALPDILDRAVEALHVFVTEGSRKAMNLFNK